MSKVTFRVSEFTMAAVPMLPTLTADEVHTRFGPIPLWRVRTSPFPATPDDVLWIQDHEDRTCELIDGILVEKDVSAEASLIAGLIVELLGAFARTKQLGFVLPPDGFLRLAPGRVRAPDVSFIRRDQTPGGRFPKKPIPDLYPTLAVEVLSPGNTQREMEEKLDDYFEAGSEAVWIVDPTKRTVRVFTDRSTESTLNAGDTLDGGTVLPGFSVAVDVLFSVLELGDET